MAAQTLIQTSGAFLPTRKAAIDRVTQLAPVGDIKVKGRNGKFR
jgi:hypothetical protein